MYSATPHPSTQPALAIERPTDIADPLTSMADQLGMIQQWCRAMSEQHRRGLPEELVRERVQALARDAGDLFQHRVIEICYLLDQNGPMRFNALRRCLGRVSTKTLAEKLTLMQERDLITRTLIDASPPGVEYHLNDHGKALTELMFPVLVHMVTGPRDMNGRAPAN
jgi:hypothetical protein